jgi:starch-binding outer membrane protein, SusD/RagB family
MKKLTIFSIFLPLAILYMTSCNKDQLELQPLNAYSDVAVWKDPVLAELFINEIYMRVHYPWSKYAIGNYVDETHRRDGSGIVNFNNCKITPDQISSDWESSSGNYFFTWQQLYISIRACNKFLANVDKLPVDNTLIDGKTKKDRMTGEATFLRAYFYYCLTSLYGGVPLVTKAYELTDDFFEPRGSYSDCIKFIADECDKAASLLPLVNTGTNKGRVTKGAALTLKSRILIYAASDLYNTVVFPSYSNPELIGYTDKSASARTARYQAAKDAAKAVIDLNLYSLYKANPSPTDSVAKNIDDYFKSIGTEEDIWLRYIIPTSYSEVREGTWMGLSGSNGYYLQGNNAPIDNLVRDYELKDGTKFDWNNAVHAAAPYINREPRFYATIFYEGAKWRARGPGLSSLDPLGVMQLGTWQKWNSSTNSMYEVYGLDTRKGPNSPFEGAYTGYYIRKFFDSNVDAQFEIAKVPIRYMRYAEVLLNYAEACIGLGQDAEARTYINMIRKRAGMPDVTESGTELRDRFRHEKRIEMVIEDQRFFDVRRWVIGPQAYVAAYKVEIVYPLLPDKTTATVPVITPKVHNSYAWINKAYFWPIKRDEMNRNKSLIQNPDY